MTPIPTQTRHAYPQGASRTEAECQGPSDQRAESLTTRCPAQVVRARRPLAHRAPHANENKGGLQTWPRPCRCTPWQTAALCTPGKGLLSSCGTQPHPSRAQDTGLGKQALSRFQPLLTFSSREQPVLTVCLDQKDGAPPTLKHQHSKGNHQRDSRSETVILVRAYAGTPLRGPASCTCRHISKHVHTRTSMGLTM